MCARSFPLHAWQHRGPHHVMCRSLHCAYLLAHHTPRRAGEPRGPGWNCLRGHSTHTASNRSMGVAWGWRSLAFASRVVLSASATGGWGTVAGGEDVRIRYQVPERFPALPGLHRVRTHHDRCDASVERGQSTARDLTLRQFQANFAFRQEVCSSSLQPHGHQEFQQDNAGHLLTSTCTCGDTAGDAE